MKTNISIFMLLCTASAIVACKKGNTSDPSPLQIKGTWELRSNTGGNILPATYAPGNGRLLRFSDTTYAYYGSGNLINKGTYQMTLDNMGRNMVTYDHQTMFWYNATMENGQLKLVPTQPDLATTFYAKQSDTTAIN